MRPFFISANTLGGNGAVRVKLNTYDAVGRPVTSKDARGNVRTLVYNAAGKMSDINCTIMPGTAATPNVHVTYETAAESVFGRVKTVSNATNHVEEYVYVPMKPADTQYGDGRLRVATKTGSHAVTYLYDILGRRVTSTSGVSGGADALTTRGWDDYGRLTSLTNLLGTEELHYEGKSGRESWTKLDHLKTSFGYDTTSGPGEHRLGSIGHTWDDAANSYTDHAYGCDGSGRLTSWAKSADGATKLWPMGYDAREQLETVSETIGTALANVHHYTYDAAGNRTSEQRNGGVRSWAANQLNQLTNR